MSAAHTTLKPYAPDAATGRVNARFAQAPLRNASPRAADMLVPDNAPRLRWLEAAIAAAEQHTQRFRDAREEAEMLMLRRPLTNERAYQLFGLLLGMLPPAAIVLRFALWSVPREPDLGLFGFILLVGLPMTFICALMGRFMGRRLAPEMAKAERRHWCATIFISLAAGFLWACATGAAGGAIVFIIGALFGLACALPFGLAGFLLFAVCHRLLARGGMIDARHFWPVAGGIALVSAALILSPGLFPY
ncbi:MAG: hypothetical protein ACJ74W_25315 [Pyrinomonadaceae bacterium]